jgi:hypothetical protein
MPPLPVVLAWLWLALLVCVAVYSAMRFANRYFWYGVLAAAAYLAAIGVTGWALFVALKGV